MKDFTAWIEIGQPYKVTSRSNFWSEKADQENKDYVSQNSWLLMDKANEYVSGSDVIRAVKGGLYFESLLSDIGKEEASPQLRKKDIWEGHEISACTLKDLKSADWESTAEALVWIRDGDEQLVLDKRSEGFEVLTEEGLSVEEMIKQIRDSGPVSAKRGEFRSRKISRKDMKHSLDQLIAHMESFKRSDTSYPVNDYQVRFVTTGYHS